MMDNQIRSAKVETFTFPKKHHVFLSSGCDILTL